jgi:hypothetical protein
MNNLLSVSAKDVKLNVKECQVVWVNGLGPLLVSDHVIDDGLDIIDGVDTEVLDHVEAQTKIQVGQKLMVLAEWRTPLG